MKLISAVPQAKKLATLRGEQISNIGSLNDEVWSPGQSRDDGSYCNNI